MPLPSKYVLIPVLIGVSGATAALIYLSLKKNESAEESSLETTSSSQATRELAIPRDCVGVVIGRAGSNIKQIQEQTNTKINFADQSDGIASRICIIRGKLENIKRAESMLKDAITNQPKIDTDEMWVPEKAAGRIVGRNGETLRHIASSSSAKITMDPEPVEKDLEGMCRVMIRGTSEQIAVARSLLEEKVEEDELLRHELKLAAANRSPRFKCRPFAITDNENNQVGSVNRNHAERLQATGRDGFLEVYISAVETPDRFWVQVLGPRAVELDRLVEQMTDYYRDEQNKTLHALTEVRDGQMVAAPFSFDELWYRARVTSINESDYAESDTRVDVLYVDYGDSGSLKKTDVCELRTDFLRLPYQAIECSLAKVKPSGGAWSDEAVDLFETLTHAAQWRVVMARVENYRDRREGSPIPCVSVCDTNGPQDVNVGDELVKQGFAEVQKEERGEEK